MTAGIDLTGSAVRAVTVDAEGRVVSRADQPSGQSDGAAAVRDVLRAFRTGADGEPSVIGVATPHPGDSLSASVTSVLVEEMPGAFVTLSAGAASALAEAWCGAVPGCRDLVALSVGRNVTAGVLLDGQLLGGSHGLAGSVGWFALNPVERDDYRRLGGLEAEIGAAGIVRRLVWRIKSGDRSAVSDQVGGDLTKLTADHVFEAARTGDGVCISVVRDTVKYVAMAIANLAAVVDPECIVIGGNIASGGDLMLDAIRAECRRRMRSQQADALRLALSTLGLDAVAIGAARAASLQRR